MIKNIAFLAIVSALVFGLWLAYQAFGEWMFLFFLVITFIVLIKDVKPKFGGKKAQPKDQPDGD